MTGYTTSAGWTSGGFNTTYEAGQEVFLAKLSDLPDTTPPTIAGFSVSQTSVLLGDSVTFSYTISDTGGSGLSHVELWRTDDLDNWPAQAVAQNAAADNGPISGSFADVPPAQGDWWYLIRVSDGAGNATTVSQPIHVVVGPPDTTAPSPDPSTWSSEPYATSPTSIRMLATPATDVNGVEYYFHETSGNPGATDSGWQDSNMYEDAGLLPGTTYTYQVMTRDKSSNHNPTGYATARSATTWLNTIVTSINSIGVREGSATAFGVKLSVQPSGKVTVSVSRVSGDTDISVTGGSSLTFTPSNGDSYQQVTLWQAQEADTVEGTATIRCSAAGLADKDVTASEYILGDMNWDGMVSIVGDVPAFVRMVYCGDTGWYQQQFPGKDPVLPGDCNGDGVLSIVGDVPGFVDCVYFGQSPGTSASDSWSGSVDSGMASEGGLAIACVACAGTASTGGAKAQTDRLPTLPGLAPINTTADDIAGQIVYLDFAGAQGVSYHGPLTVGPFDVPAFQAPDALAGQEPTIIADVSAELEQTFAGTGAIFTTERPDGTQPHSTIYIGGDGSEFASYGSFLGVAEQVDIENRQHGDDAWVFADRLGQGIGDTNVLADSLADVIAHEVGHLLGYSHT